MKCPECGKKNKPHDDFCEKCGHRLKKEVHKITLGLIVSWILGVLFGISGLTFIFQGAIKSGTALVLASLILLPPVNSFVKKEFNFEMSRGLKIVAVIILFIIYGVTIQKSDVFRQPDIEIQPTESVQKETPPEPTQSKATEPEPTPEPEPPKPEPTPVKKVKSASLTIDRVQIQLANLYPTRITVTNTGDVTIYTKFDIYVYDDNGKEVCAGSPMLSDPSSVDVGGKETGELLMMGCMFDKDGTYTLKIDLLDTDYNKLDTKTKDFTIDYWKQFEIDI